ncbi:hypothetical protein EC957_003844 [Mortierella hygrophila]|uniref:Galactose oxidase n=1 Tax=Mortierella hygrophila TaxID=979708 RepID=A0A9P6K753_9FUNG|nr:hypothetical protein EC957_003844 [Mortierella hygrophila]
MRFTNTSSHTTDRTQRMRLTWLSILLFATTSLSSLLTASAQSKGPGPRAGHCIVEHSGVVYVLGGTPPSSSEYANFTSLKLPQSNWQAVSPDTFPWVDLPAPPVSVHIPALTMTYDSLKATLTPSWTDCFATDDGRIVVVGGSAQLLVYDIGSQQWSQPAASIKFGPSVSSGMFQDPVYIQSRILGDGVTGLVVCTLNWNSQPQPYYLNTETWTVTLAIGTSLTTPPSVPGTSNGWGVVPGGGPLLPPNGFRHFSLVVMGNTAYIMGGYSTLLTGQISDWNSITSFPVLQAPSTTVVMFGNAGTLTVTTRGSVAYPISDSTIHILPGNRGGNSQSLQLVQTFAANQVTATALALAEGGPRNSIFRGATLIGRGGNQIFMHGGLKSLDFNVPAAVPPPEYFDNGAAVWNGASQTWGDSLVIYVPPAKSKGLMIGLIVGGVALLVLIGLGIWYYKRRQRRRILEEEEERQAKGMVLKNEDVLQKEHKPIRSFDENSSARPTPPIAYYVAGRPDGGSDIGGTYQAMHLSNGQGYAEAYAAGRGASSETIRRSPYQEFGQVTTAYAQPELVDDDFAVQTIDSPRYFNSPQDYSSLGHDAMDSTTSPTLINNDGLISRAPSKYQAVVSTTGHPVFGHSADQISKREYHDGTTIATAGAGLGPVEGSADAAITHPYQTTTTADGSSYVLPNPAAQRSEPYFVRPYSQTSTSNLSPSPPMPRSQLTPVSPSFSATYSMPESSHGGGSSNDSGGVTVVGDSVNPLLPPNPSTEESPAYAHQQHPPSAVNNQTHPAF